MIAACAAFGANAPNGADEGAVSGVKQAVLVASGACIAGFAGDSNVRSQVSSRGAKRARDP
jgi:hypothetical protein